VEKERNVMETELPPLHGLTKASEQAQVVKPPLPERPPRGVWRILSAILFYGGIGFFLINLIGLIGVVVLGSLGDHWFASWLPEGGYSFQWYQFEAQHHDIVAVLINTLVVSVCSTGIAMLIGFPAAYVLARKRFRFKSLLMAVYLVPMLVPPLAYGIPLATLLLRYLGSSLPSVVVINLVPVIPFVILILVPFIEQIDTSLESASHMLGANQFQTFLRVLLPLVVPGLLTAGVLAIVRTVSMFDLTYLVADASSQTLILSLYGDATASGITPAQAIDALSVVYMLTTMSLLGIALIFVKPTQFVVRIKTKQS
jgi:putative spermidine/putrescine transport system permease protein